MPKKLTRKQVKLQANAIMESDTLKEAYKKTHNCSDNTASKHAWEMLRNPEIVAELEKQLATVKPLEINKVNLVKCLTLVIQSWQSGKEKTADFIRAVEILSRLVPEFSEKHSVEAYQSMTDEQIAKTLSDKLAVLRLPHNQ